MSNVKPGVASFCFSGIVITLLGSNRTGAATAQQATCEHDRTEIIQDAVRHTRLAGRRRIQPVDSGTIALNERACTLNKWDSCSSHPTGHLKQENSCPLEAKLVKQLECNHIEMAGKGCVACACHLSYHNDEPYCTHPVCTSIICRFRMIQNDSVTNPSCVVRRGPGKLKQK